MQFGRPSSSKNSTDKVGLDQCVRWWIHRCLIRQLRKMSRQGVHWPVITPCHSPTGPVKLLYLGIILIPCPSRGAVTTKRRRTCSRHAAIYAVSESNYTAEGTTITFVYKYVTPGWVSRGDRCPTRDNSFLTALPVVVSKLLSSHQIFTSSYHPNTNGRTGRVCHTVAKMRSSATNEGQTDCDLHLALYPSELQKIGLHRHRSRIKRN